MSVIKIACIIVGLSAANNLHASFYVEVGPWHRGEMSVTVKGGSEFAGTGVISDNAGTSYSAVSVQLTGLDDDGSSQILREFDDGFVGPSGMPLFLDQGQTQHFGFERDAQHNAQAGTLSFTKTQSGTGQSSRTTTRLSSTAVPWEATAKLDGFGVQARAGMIVTHAKHWDLSAQAEVGWLSGMNRTLHTRSAFQQELIETDTLLSVQRTETFVFAFDTFNNPAFPSAPYHMTDPTGVGPLISDTPISIQSAGTTESESERLIASRQIVGHSAVELQTEATSLVIGLGPRFRARFSDRIAFLAQGGCTLSLLDVQLRRNETFTTEDGHIMASTYDQLNDQKWVWGASLVVGGQWMPTERLTVSAKGGYDWAQRTRFAIGTDEIRYDLSGYRVELSIGWVFGGPRE